MFKTVKKLKKLWLRKKRRKKTTSASASASASSSASASAHHHHLNHSTCAAAGHYCCCSSSCPAAAPPAPSELPSAPPLPPWLDFLDPDHHHHHQHITKLEAAINSPTQELNYPAPAPAHVHQTPQETLVQNQSGSSYPYSYQQYMSPNPVYGGQMRSERTSAGGGVLGFGCVAIANLFRCLFPCFYVREAAPLN